MFNQKGQIRILEAFLSIGVVFSAALISVAFPPSTDLTKAQSLAHAGIQILIELDTNGTLGDLITQENWQSIKQSIHILLPAGVLFNLTIFDENLTQINPEVIQNSDLLGQETVSVEYVCATESLNAEFFILRLQLAWIR